LLAVSRTSTFATMRKSSFEKKKNKSSCKAHDSAYKRLFSHPELVADLIRGYVDPRMARGWD
jgi:hypothetical protein